MNEGPYTTITVESYNLIVATMRHLRRRIQTAREHLERGDVQAALAVLKFEADQLGQAGPETGNDGPG